MSDYVLSASLELKDKFTTTIRTAVNEFKQMDTDIGSVTSAVKKKFKDMELDTAKGWKNMQSSVNGFVKNTAVGMVTGSGLVGAFLKSSYMGYVDLNEQLTRNAAITGASAEEQEKLKKQVDDLGASTKFTALEVAQAQMYQAMAGYKTNEILEVTPTLMKLAIATGEDLAATSDMVTDNLSAFGLSVQDAGMFADLLANVANNTNTSVAMLGGAFKYVGTTSRSMGEDVREVAVMLGIAADNGIKAEQAGTGLRGIYARLSKITPDMRKQFELTNTKLYDQNGKFKGLRKIIEESKPALEKLTAEQRNNWLATIAGTEGMSLWNAILNNSVESTKKAERAAYNATGALEKFVGVMSKTDRQKIDELSSAFDGFKQKLGEALSPIILENVQKLTTYLNEMTNSDNLSTEKIEDFFKKIEKYSKLAAGGVIAFNAATLFARALTGDPTAWVTLAGLSTMGGAYAGYKIADKYFNPEKEKDKKIEREYYYETVWEQVDKNRELHYNYELPEPEKKGYDGKIAEGIVNSYIGNTKYGPRIKSEDIFENFEVTENNENIPQGQEYIQPESKKEISSFKEYIVKNELLKEENSINNVNENVSNSLQEDNSSEINNTISENKYENLAKSENNVNNFNENISNEYSSSQNDYSKKINNNTVSENIYKNSEKSENIVNNEVVKPKEVSKTPNVFEKTINLNLSVDVRGLENTENKSLIKDITKEVLYEAFRDANIKYELRT